ncbi:MAG: hypothetical protein IT203_01840 [Fimbriimonadaceae bacterium]|nr:hypothetical protein [Fimbriimonadaceae bacterium]
MLALLASAAILFSGAQSDTKTFTESFAKRRSDHPSAKVDPAISQCLDILIAKLLKETSAKTTSADVEMLLKPYSEAVSSGDFMETSYRNLQGAVSRGFGRIAVGVHMGAVSRLRVFHEADESPIPIPALFDWVYQYGSVPILMHGGDILVDGMGFQDAGVRYGYRLWFLHPLNGKYQLTKTMSGIWTLAESDGDYHIGLQGQSVLVKSVEPPTSFATDSSTRLITVHTTYQPVSGQLKLVSREVKEPAVQAVDRWMTKAMKSPATEMEKRFAKAYGKEPLMVEEWSEEILFSRPAKVELVFGKRFRFTLKESGKGYVVTGLSIK